MLRMFARTHRSQAHTRCSRSRLTDQLGGGQSSGDTRPQLTQLTVAFLSIGPDMYSPTRGFADKL
jgi:hypothetical protein